MSSSASRTFVQVTRSLFCLGYSAASLAGGVMVTSAVLVALTAYRSSSFRQEFVRGLGNGDSDAAGRTLTDFKRPLPFQNFLYLPASLRAIRTKGDIDTITEDVFTALQLLDKAKYSRTSEQFFGRVDGQLRILLESLPQDTSRLVSLEALRQQLISVSNAETQLLGPLAKAEQQNARGLERYKQQAILLEDIILETAELFSLKPERFPSDDLKVERFYSGGILAGLPKLQGLADHIANPDALAIELTKLGGKVNLHGTNVPEQFKNRINDLKASVEVFSTTMRQISESLSSSNSALKETQRILNKNKTLARSNLVLLLEGLAELPTSAEKNPYFLLLDQFVGQNLS